MHPAIKVGAVLKNKLGDTVEILKTDLDNGEYPILGVVNNKRTETYTINGIAFYSRNEPNLDLPPIFNPAKPVRTRDGKPARIIYIGEIKGREETIGALVTFEDDSEFWETYFENGQIIKDDQHTHDLINIPE